MDVITAPEVPDSEEVRALRQELAVALAENHATIGPKSSPDQVRLVAIIVLSPVDEAPVIGFAWVATANEEVRLAFGMPPDGKPLTIEQVRELSAPNKRCMELEPFGALLKHGGTLFHEMKL